MKSWSFRLCIIIISTFCYYTNVVAGTQHTQSHPSDSTAKTSLDTRHHEGYKGWKRLIPTHIKAQYAGGIGVAAVGCGWDYGKRCRWESDIMLGILPKCYADATHITFSIKQCYIPWSIRLYDTLSIEPFTVAATISFINGDSFWIKTPKKYPGHRYYEFSSRMRMFLSFGQRFTLSLRNQSTVRSLGLYYEFSICDLDIMARVTNKSLSFDDMFHFSIGAKIQLLSQKK